MKDKNLSKNLSYFGEFIYKINNYFIVAFNNFNLLIAKNYHYVNDDFIYCIFIRGIHIIEKIFIYNIYISNYEIQSLQNISKKLIDLYFKFIDQLIAMNNNINLSIKDAEIFIYKKMIDKSINNFKNLNKFEKNLIDILKLNNSYLLNRISNYKCKNYNFKNIDINFILNYSKEMMQIIKTM